MMPMKTLRVILWDQLSESISSLEKADRKNDIILMMETREECLYVKHHKKKLTFLLSSMRHFAEECKEKGFRVEYAKLNDESNAHSIKGEISRFALKYNPDVIAITWPGEYRILNSLLELKKQIDIPINIIEDDRFLSSITDFKAWSSNRKNLRMEYFYREMRKKYHILMSDEQPVGGQWNYDKENRQFPDHELKIPINPVIKADTITQEVINLVAQEFSDHFGELYPFEYAVTREQALVVLKHFIKNKLPLFGDYQDIMLENEPWLYHSVISLYLNTGLLLPMECIQAAEQAYTTGHAPLNSTEGFIRQILGWREYVRGIYWTKMPDYKQSNYLQATRPLPSFYWTAETPMNCVKQCVKDTKNNAYAHHIQRLMVLGNFAMLAGINPDQVNEWYLLVYADAHEWVELPNVTGMILFADGGYLASKPYVSSGAYINKMSNYCENCQYLVKEKNGKNGCPFNYLYWDFFLKHANKLKSNQRLSMVFYTLSRMTEARIKLIQADAETFLTQLE
jgi:deoxyribodipyrimidine photolyase-related protein